jgi:hypothetical protein
LAAQLVFVTEVYLESALSRPYQTFDENELYNSPVEKAAALIESIIINHPLIDGNKRFGYVAMRLPFDEADEIEDDVLNQIVWYAMKGYDVPYPKVRRK